MKKPPHVVPPEAAQYNFCRDYRLSVKEYDDIGVLLSKAWKTCEELRDLSPVNNIEGNFPILWFGDMDAYLRSETRVITVGLSPSDREFSTPRFFTYAERKISKGEPKYRGRVPLTLSHWENKEFERIRWAYNNYFQYKPFAAYFNCYEKALCGLGCDVSYAGRKLGNTSAKNTAIHIDLMSPIATKPNWNKLSPSEKERMTGGIFCSLLAYLRPNIVLFSSRKKDFLSAVGLHNPVFTYPTAFDENDKTFLECYRKSGVNYVWGCPGGNPFKMIPEEMWDVAFFELRKYLAPVPKPDEGVFWIVPDLPRERLPRTYKIFDFEKDGSARFNECMREPGHYILSVFDHTQKSHYELWKTVVERYPEMAKFHFDFFPFGRVWTNEKGKSVIYSHESFEWEAMLEELKTLFRLKEIVQYPWMKKEKPPKPLVSYEPLSDYDDEGWVFPSSPKRKRRR